MRKEKLKRAVAFNHVSHVYNQNTTPFTTEN